MRAADQEQFRRRVGSVLLGKWKLERLLGVGGMAAVYEATHKIGRREAIKILHPEVSRSADLRARFEQEARAVNAFRHAGAVEVRDVDTTEDGQPFMVMELLEGESLLERQKRLGTLELAEVLRLTDALLDVLAAAHAVGIIHRDVKLDNLFLQRDGHLKVLDFGIARLRDNAQARTLLGTTLGTVPYMPPEQIKGIEIDARVDLFAAGAVMRRLLTGRMLHEAQTEAEMLVKMLTVPAARLATVLPGAAPGLCSIVDRALAFERARRYPDARTMQQDLRAFAAGHAPPFATERLAAGDEPDTIDEDPEAVESVAADAVPDAGGVPPWRARGPAFADRAAPHALTAVTRAPGVGAPVAPTGIGDAALFASQANIGHPGTAGTGSAGGAPASVAMESTAFPVPSAQLVSPTRVSPQAPSVGARLPETASTMASLPGSAMQAAAAAPLSAAPAPSAATPSAASPRSAAGPTSGWAAVDAAALPATSVLGGVDTGAGAYAAAASAPTADANPPSEPLSGGANGRWVSGPMAAQLGLAARAPASVGTPSASPPSRRSDVVGPAGTAVVAAVTAVGAAVTAVGAPSTAPAAQSSSGPTSQASTGRYGPSGTLVGDEELAAARQRAADEQRRDKRRLLFVALGFGGVGVALAFGIARCGSGPDAAVAEPGRSEHVTTSPSSGTLPASMAAASTAGATQTGGAAPARADGPASPSTSPPTTTSPALPSTTEPSATPATTPSSPPPSPPAPSPSAPPSTRPTPPPPPPPAPTTTKSHGKDNDKDKDKEKKGKGNG